MHNFCLFRKDTQLLKNRPANMGLMINFKSNLFNSAGSSLGPHRESGCRSRTDC